MNDNVRQLHADQPLERRQIALDVLEWSLLIAVLEHVGRDSVTSLAAQVRRQLEHPSSQVSA